MKKNIPVVIFKISYVDLEIKLGFYDLLDLRVATVAAWLFA